MSKKFTKQTYYSYIYEQAKKAQNAKELLECVPNKLIDPKSHWAIVDICGAWELLKEKIKQGYFNNMTCEEMSNELHFMGVDVQNCGVTQESRDCYTYVYGTACSYYQINN